MSAYKCGDTDVRGGDSAACGGGLVCAGPHVGGRRVRGRGSHVVSGRGIVYDFSKSSRMFLSLKLQKVSKIHPKPRPRATTPQPWGRRRGVQVGDAGAAVQARSWGRAVGTSSGRDAAP